jgi:hypothetical protein
MVSLDQDFKGMEVKPSTIKNLELGRSLIFS